MVSNYWFILQYAKSKLQDIEDGNVAMWKNGMEKAFELLKKVNQLVYFYLKGLV